MLPAPSGGSPSDDGDDHGGRLGVEHDEPAATSALPPTTLGPTTLPLGVEC